MIYIYDIYICTYIYIYIYNLFALRYNFVSFFFKFSLYLQYKHSTDSNRQYFAQFEFPQLLHYVIEDSIILQATVKRTM